MKDFDNFMDDVIMNKIADEEEVEWEEKEDTYDTDTREELKNGRTKN